VEYRISSGCDLPGVEDGSIDAIWSFDVFVHVAPVDQAGYLDEIARVLRRGGVAGIHHADGRNRGSQPSRTGWRAPMSAHLFAVLARKRGLIVERQLRSWANGRFGLGAYGDVITIMRR
jgi:ubiquinone/menaquinone biosynthesis C-methylase UbiE